MNANTVIGYAYDADTHCPDCTFKRFPYGLVYFQHDAYDLSQDSEGNDIHPIFGDQGVNEDDGNHYCCGDCFVDLLTGDLPAWVESDPKHYESLTGICLEVAR